MQTQEIIYQHSPQFLPKISMKLENLLATIHEARHESHPIMHHYALKNLVEILKIIEKPELKSRLTKEFMRLNYILTKLESFEDNKLKEHFSIKTDELQSQSLRFCNLLQQDNFLQTLRLRSNDQWQDCELQPPLLYRWLHQKSSCRKNILSEWADDLKDLESVISIYLGTLRELTVYENIDIHQSFYHKPITSNPPCQLVMVKINSSLPIIPKFQIGSHSISIHFTDIHAENKASAPHFNMNIGLVRI